MAKTPDKTRPAREQGLSSTALTAIFTATTPFPGLPEVSLTRVTWDDHVLKQHPYMVGKEQLVQATVSAPSVIVRGTSNPDYIIFINQAETSSEGNPLTVIASPHLQIIVTSLYHRSFKVIAPELVIWPPQQK